MFNFNFGSCKLGRVLVRVIDVGRGAAAETTPESSHCEEDRCVHSPGGAE